MSLISSSLCLSGGCHPGLASSSSEKQIVCYCHRLNLHQALIDLSGRSCFKPPVSKDVVRSKAVVLLLLTCCLLLLPLWESVIVLCFVVRYFMTLQSSW